MSEATPTYITFTAGVTADSVQRLLAAVDAAATAAPQVHLLFASPGGNINSGLTAYHLLRAMPTELVTYNAGSVASIAVIMYLAGVRRYVARRAKFLTHGSAWTFTTPLQEKQLRQYLAAAVADNALMAGVIADQTRINYEDAHALLASEHVKNAECAVADGFAHEIRDPAIPQGARTVIIA